MNYSVSTSSHHDIPYHREALGHYPPEHEKREFKHFVIVKFKEGVAVDDLTKGMEKLVSEIHAVKSFEWYFSVFIPCSL